MSAVSSWSWRSEEKSTIAADDPVGAIDGVAHLGEDLRDIGVAGFDTAAQVLDPHQQQGERVLDLVGDPGGHASDRFELLGLDQLQLRRFQLRRGLAQVLVELLELLPGVDALGDVLADADQQVAAADLVLHRHLDGVQPDFAALFGIDDLFGHLEGQAALEDALVDLAEIVRRLLGEQVVVGLPEGPVSRDGGDPLLLLVPQDHAEVVGGVLDEERHRQVVQDVAEKGLAVAQNVECLFQPALRLGLGQTLRFRSVGHVVVPLSPLREMARS